VVVEVDSQTKKDLFTLPVTPRLELELELELEL
jgi:hypothetical protein